MSDDQFELFEKPDLSDYTGEDGLQCIKCSRYKHVDDFPRAVGGEVKRTCRACMSHAKKIRDELKKLHPYPDKDHRCPICDRTIEEVGAGSKTPMLSQWVLDHDHETGEFRGHICYNCNVGLGAFRDDISLLNSAETYLKEHEERRQDETSS